MYCGAVVHNLILNMYSCKTANFLLSVVHEEIENTKNGNNKQITSPRMCVSKNVCEM